MSHLTSKQAVEVLRQTSALLKEARAQLLEKDAQLATFQKLAYAQELAGELRAKNLSSSFGSDEREVVQHLMQLPATKLAAIEEAVKLATPYHPLGHVRMEQSSSEPGVRTPGSSALEQFILGYI